MPVNYDVDSSRMDQLLVNGKPPVINPNATLLPGGSVFAAYCPTLTRNVTAVVK